jgi:hypothetical protein
MITEITKTNIKDVDTSKPKCLWDYNLLMGSVEDQDAGG